MTDLDSQLRRALGEPPVDHFARERALVRLRSRTADAGESKATKGHSWRTQVLVAGLALVTVAVALFGMASLRRPALADELDHLAQANVAWSRSGTPSEIRIEQWGHQPNVLVGGQTFTMIVHSLVTLTIRDDSIRGTEEILSADFASEEDRDVWKARGSPEIPVAGTVDPFAVPGDAYNIDAIPADPEKLLAALKDGSVSGYRPTPGQLFESIASLLTDPRLSAAQRVALYQVVGSVDGVELMGDTPDPLGRVGVGFSCMVGPRRQVLIFNRDTGEPLAFEEFSSIDPSQVDQWQAFDPPS